MTMVLYKLFSKNKQQTNTTDHTNEIFGTQLVTLQQIMV